MFSRRKSRSAQPIAYTGVNHAAPASNQPNNNALAAALTIGNGIKNDPPAKPATSITRSTSFQYVVRNPPKLGLKRSSSITSKPSPIKHSLESPVHYNTHVRLDNSSLDIDDTINDTFSQNSDNYTKMQDLKLSHVDAGPKMVKKYIPTRSGIKIVEVPEQSLQQEIHRSNSIRSGVNISRANSLAKSAPRTRTLTQKPAPRASSFTKNTSSVKSSRTSSLTKSPTQASFQPTISSSPSSPETSSFIDGPSSSLLDIQKQIDYEKQLAKDLEKKRLEYEELRLARLQNEKKLLEMMKEDTIKEEVEEEEEPESKVVKPELVEVVFTEDDVIPESAINPADVVVDEVEKKEIHTDLAKSGEMAIINDYANYQSRESLKVSDDESDYDESPTRKNKPKFDAHPEIIDNLTLPHFEQGISSSSSISSVDSGRKRPVKSAMKKSHIVAISQSEKQNAAHQAYLSLTTAENTRLNSKLSNSNISEQSPKVQNGASFRQEKKPAQLNGSLSSRSLRPNSIHVDRNVDGLSMRNRTMRDRSSVYVQPIAPHPALGPNYQSPSKLRASELYAKANARPVSTFNPQLLRKSSFDKTGETPEGQVPGQAPVQNHALPQARASHRLTLRDSPYAPTQFHRLNNTVPSPVTSAPPKVEPAPQPKFSSRFADSDDDEPHTPQKPAPAPQTPQKTQSHIMTLRPEPEQAEKESKKKAEKKPKKKFLRKIFGKH